MHHISQHNLNQLKTFFQCLGTACIVWHRTAAKTFEEAEFSLYLGSYSVSLFKVLEMYGFSAVQPHPTSGTFILIALRLKTLQ